MSGLIDQIINVTTTVSAAGAQRANFGTPLALAYHSHYTDRYRVYTDPSQLVADGFSTTEAAYLMATSICEQEPRPPSFLLGRLSNAVAQTFTFLVTDNTAGDKVGMSLLAPNGTTYDAAVTVPASSSPTAVAALLTTQLSAIPGLAATSSGATVTVTVATAGTVWYPTTTPATAGNPGVVTGGSFTDTTSSASPQNDLAAIVLLNSNFYGASGQSIAAADIAAISAWCASNGDREHWFTTADTAATSTSSNILKTQGALGYKGVLGLFNKSPGTFPALGAMAKYYTTNPGASTVFAMTIDGSAVDTLSPTEMTNITANNGNFYTLIAGLTALFDGRSVSGQWMDLHRSVGALNNEIQVRGWQFVKSATDQGGKVALDQVGIDGFALQVKSAIGAFTVSKTVPNQFLSNDPGSQPVVNAPTRASLAPTDVANRLLNAVTWSAVATSGGQAFKINGSVNL